MHTWPSWYSDSEVVGFQLHFMFDTYKLIILSKHVVHIPKFSYNNSRNFCAGENDCITVSSSSLLRFFSSATEWKETLRPFLLSLRQSYCAAALEYVDIVNQPIRLGIKPNDSWEKVLESLLPTLRGYNPLAGISNKAEEEQQRIRRNSAEHRGKMLRVIPREVKADA